MGQAQPPDTVGVKKQVHVPSWQQWRAGEEPTTWVAFLMQQRQGYQDEARDAKKEYEQAQQELQKSGPTRSGALHFQREEQRVKDLDEKWQYLVQAVQEYDEHLAAMECPKERSVSHAGSDDGGQTRDQTTASPSAQPPSDVPTATGGTAETA